VRIIAKRTLRAFWQRRPDAKAPLEAWHSEVRAADWSRPRDVKERFATASILRNDRVVFNLCGNKYRMVVKIAYRFRIVYIRFLGTHAEYDRIDAENI
jgi:mRNA interferase HigB